MEAGQILEYLKGKSILVTGATGFLGKIFVEKVLRVQPDVKKFLLLVRATNATSAKQRLQSEVIEKELFKALKEKHGDAFYSFITEKVSPIAGDIVHEHLGIEDSTRREELWKEIDIVINVAATTRFYERYDVALAVNVLGVKNVLQFAKKCEKLKMLLHVSTAYVAGIKEGLILEEPFHMGESLQGNSYIDIEAELRLIEKRKMDVDEPSDEKIAMKELGIERARFFGWPNVYVYTKALGEMLLGHLRGDLPLVIARPTIITSIYKEPLPGWMEGSRTIDSLIIGYAKGQLSCFLGDPELTMDVIPGDMVVNTMIVTMVAHSNQHSQFIYHISSSMRNPATYSTLEESGYHYFLEHPRIGKDGKLMKTNRLRCFRTLASFHKYMALRYMLPLQGLRLMNLLSFQLLSRQYNELSRKYNFVMQLADLYAPYAFFKGRFDDANLEGLRTAMKDNNEDSMFNFDPKWINWKEYFCNIHIPGVLKYA